MNNTKRDHLVDGFVLGDASKKDRVELQYYTDVDNEEYDDTVLQIIELKNNFGLLFIQPDINDVTFWQEDGSKTAIKKALEKLVNNTKGLIKMKLKSGIMIKFQTLVHIQTMGIIIIQ